MSLHIDKINKNKNSFLIIPTLSHYTKYVDIDLNSDSLLEENRAKRIFTRHKAAILKFSKAYNSLLAINKNYNWSAIGRL